MSLPVVVERGSPGHRVWQVACGILLLLVVGYVLGPGRDYLVLRWSQAVTFALAILGLNLVTGYSGQISLGSAAFFGIGAYTTMILVADHGWPFLATLPVSALFGWVVGLLLGIPALRIRGLYLSLVTLGMSLAFPSLVKAEQLGPFDVANLTGGSNGKTITVGRNGPNGFRWLPPSWAPDSWGENEWTFLTVVIISIVLFFLVGNLVNSRIGRGTVAMRDNEVGAAVSGVHPAKYKILAFANSSLITAVAGSCFALAGRTIAPDSFGLLRSIEFIAGLVIGGVATIIGPAIGGVIVEFVPYLSFKFLPGPEANVLYGLVLIAIIFFMPGGVAYGIRYLRERLLVIRPRLPRSVKTPVEVEPVSEAQSPLAYSPELSTTPQHQPGGGP